MSTKWIFFDLGSTLIDETKAYIHRIREMTEGTKVSYDDFENKRIEFAGKGLDDIQETIKYFRLKKTPWHLEDEILFMDSVETLDYLKNRGYKLGIIANQMPGVSQRLDKWGILKFFDIVVSSAELGVSKPDKRIFEKAFELAGCLPTESVMVGDRLDNDIKPAKSLGMKTIWIRTELSKYQDSNYGKDIADKTIDYISKLQDIF